MAFFGVMFEVALVGLRAGVGPGLGEGEAQGPLAPTCGGPGWGGRGGACAPRGVGASRALWEAEPVRGGAPNRRLSWGGSPRRGAGRQGRGSR